jgi:outer membrane receptor protein involved in Fe transport
MRTVGFNPEDSLPKTFDLARVEVLRGPQGTLFGAGAEGGAVRYILTQPSLTASSTYVRSEGNYTQYAQPSYEFGIAHGQPMVNDVFGWRASAWYRYDGGWVNRVDPTTRAVLAHNVDYQHTLVLRLAGLWQATSSLAVTPSVLYQDRQQHDAQTYWPAYSNPGSWDFNTATPERIPDPDRYFLSALKVQWDLGKSSIISNTSYFHRNGLTGYQGTVYDLFLYQSSGWPGNTSFGIPAGGVGLGCEASGNAANCPWYPLLDGRGIHLPTGFANEQTPNLMTNQQRNYVQELRWQSNDESARLRWTAGAFWQLARELSIEELRDRQIDQFWVYLYGVPATQQFTCSSAPCGSFLSAYSCPGDPYYPTGYSVIPQCDIYYNNNVTFDRQIAGYGELSYALSGQLRLTLGERVARSSFNLDHYSDGLENFGPSSKTANEHETSNTPKASLAWQVNDANMFYATYAKGFRPGGGNAPLPGYCTTGGASSPLAMEGYPNGAPLTYKSDATQSYELGSKNSFGRGLRIATSVYYIRWNDIQQNVYVAGTCGLQFTDNLGTAVAKGFDVQAELALGGLHLDLAVGYTNARFTKTSYPNGNPAAPPLALAGDAISGEAAIDYAPGTNPPWTVAVGPEYRFKLAQRDAFVRIDYQYQSRNPWLAAVQDPLSSQYISGTYTLPATHFASARAGLTLGDWLVTPFIDNLFNTHIVTNYALGQQDFYNPAGSPSQQQNVYTFRPRTFGVTATWRAGPGG